MYYDQLQIQSNSKNNNHLESGSEVLNNHYVVIFNCSYYILHSAIITYNLRTKKATLLQLTETKSTGKTCRDDTALMNPKIIKVSKKKYHFLITLAVT